MEKEVSFNQRSLCAMKLNSYCERIGLFDMDYFNNCLFIFVVGLFMLLGFDPSCCTTARRFEVRELRRA